MLPFLHLLLIFLSSSVYFADGSLYSQRFKPAVNKGIINDYMLSEASGMVASRKHKGMFWVINDSGNDPRIYLIDENGTTFMSYLVQGFENKDWEDLTMYTDTASGITEIYIGDIGDNFAIRNHINILKFDEPGVIDKNDSIITNVNNFCFRYEDGARDAETLLMDPITKGLYIITKREKNVRIYEAPKLEVGLDTINLIFRASLPFNNVTSGDITQDGAEILLKNYNAIFYWKRAKQESVENALLKDHELLIYTPEPQGESIAWKLEKDGFYTLSERNYPIDQVLYYYERNPK